MIAHSREVYGTNVARADVSDPNDLLAVVTTWPEEWRDSFAEREAIMAIDASHPYVPAIRAAFKDVVRVAERLDVDLSNWLGSRAELIRVLG